MFPTTFHKEISTAEESEDPPSLGSTFLLYKITRVVLGQVIPSQPDGYFWTRSSELFSCTMVAESSNGGLYRSESKSPKNCSYNILVILQKYLPQEN